MGSSSGEGFLKHCHEYLPYNPLFLQATPGDSRRRMWSSQFPRRSCARITLFSVCLRASSAIDRPVILESILDKVPFILSLTCIVSFKHHIRTKRSGPNTILQGVGKRKYSTIRFSTDEASWVQRISLSALTIYPTCIAMVSLFIPELGHTKKIKCTPRYFFSACRSSFTENFTRSDRNDSTH